MTQMQQERKKQTLNFIEQRKRVFYSFKIIKIKIEIKPSKGRDVQTIYAQITLKSKKEKNLSFKQERT